MTNKMTKEELAFLEKGRELGFNIITHEGIQKIELNLQSPINLAENFELPSKFNHLIYYCVAPFTMEEIEEELKDYEDNQLHDIFRAENIIDGESYQNMKKRLRKKIIKRMEKVVRALRIRSNKIHKTKYVIYSKKVSRHLRYKKSFFTF